MLVQKQQKYKIHLFLVGKVKHLHKCTKVSQKCKPLLSIDISEKLTTRSQFKNYQNIPTNKNVLPKTCSKQQILLGWTFILIFIYANFYSASKKSVFIIIKLDNSTLKNRYYFKVSFYLFSECLFLLSLFTLNFVIFYFFY